MTEITDRTGIWVRYLKHVAHHFPEPLTINTSDILNEILFLHLADHPDEAIEDVRDALIRLGVPEKDRENIIVRFTGWPRRTRIRDLEAASHINHFISVEGLIRKATDPRPYAIHEAYRCECGKVSIDPANMMCQCGKKLIKSNRVDSRCTFINCQRIEIQETHEGLRGREQPRPLPVDLFRDLTGKFQPGDRVIISGILRTVEKKGNFSYLLEASSIEPLEIGYEDLDISKEDEAAIIRLSKDPDLSAKLIGSIAPIIYGYDVIKEAIGLMVFGGVTKEAPDGSRLRGNIHILLVGDPGTAKSFILKYVRNLSPKGIYTSGKSSTAVGLTSAATQDSEGRWTVEAGALVLADMGLCCVDELDKMKPEDRDALNEAMEQQTVSVAKADIITTLRARCTLLGAANPKLGRFDDYTSIPEQINMPPNLLSRFDLIFVMKDQPDPKRDEILTEHILKTHAGSARVPIIDAKLFRKYVALARRITPHMTDEAHEILKTYFLKIRGLAGNDKPVPITMRQIEGMIRLAEASARTRLSEIITIEDAQRTVRIVDACLRQVAYDPNTGTFDIDKVATSTGGKAQRGLYHEILAVLGQDALKITAVVASLGSYRPDQVEVTIEAMKREGILFSPRDGLIRRI